MRSNDGKGGCGCGGSTADCHCGKASCETCRLEGFVRPRFFPGQLLTEEDLQLLDAYAVAKNRLHNRYFWGDGVVCGLEVTMHPCDEGKVLVAPGYALDCCGNDIVVACRQELDVNRLIRDLRTKLRGGYDCGDPCAEKKEALPASPASSTRPLPGAPATPINDVERAGTKYCLYIHYCESESDPVSPYSTGDQCGAATCEPSRVREGFRFELRCEEEAKPRPSITNTLCECIRDEVRLARSATAVTASGMLQNRFAMASAYAKNPNDADAVRKLTGANTRLRALIPDTIDQAWVGTKLDEALRAAEPVIMFTARTFRAPGEAQPLATSRRKSTATGAAAASASAMRVAADSLSWIANLPSDPIVKEELTQRRSDVERLNAEAIASKAAALLRAQETGEIDESERKRLAAGLIVTDSLAEAAQRVIDDTAGDLNLAPRFEPRSFPRIGDVPAFSVTEAAANENAIRRFDETSRALVAFQTRVADSFQECLCRALLPPCRVCEDQAVLIACISVLDCEVVDICNLERRFVLTPVNLRYWLPDIDKAGEALERWCCEKERRRSSMWSDLADAVTRQCLRNTESAQRASMHVQTIYSSPARRTSSALEPAEPMFALASIARLEARIRKLEEQQK